MSTRPKRQVQIKSETPLKRSRRWTDAEMETLLDCLMKFGHKNLEKLQEHIPGRSIDNIKTFIRTIYDTYGKTNKNYEAMDEWIQLCDNLEGTPWRDCIQIAQILKYLSVDGLLENHPLPNCCGGIDFGQAYRLLYQAMMGYPIQPVSKPTADFVFECLGELIDEIKKQTSAINNVELFLKTMGKEKTSKVSKVTSEFLIKKENNSATDKKPLKVYKRKKTDSAPAAPSLKITIEETPDGGNSTSGCSKDFSLIVERNNCTQSTTVNVPVACSVAVCWTILLLIDKLSQDGLIRFHHKSINYQFKETIVFLLPGSSSAVRNKDEEELLKSSSYNPFEIPGRWLEEPLYLSLHRNK